MTKIKGPGSERVDATDSLQAVIAEVDPKTEILHITGDVPTNDEWEALGQHFTGVRFLNVATGWDENWIDDKFPLNWPIELLIIADAISERISTPAIMEGRIKHLILFFTCGLRFEGPSVKELIKDAEVIFTIPRKKAPDAETQAEGALSEGAVSQAEENQPADSDSATKSAPESDVIKVTSYADRDITFSPDRGDAPPSEMKTLEILGNDALEMLTYIALAKFHLLTSLESLTLLSSHGNDLRHVPATLFPCFLPALDELKHFKLTLGSDVHAKILDVILGNKPYLHMILPPNIETLRFRGPVSMTSHMDTLAAAFADDAAFLPRLKRISLLLDLPEKASEHPKEASLEQLRAAHAACKRVLDAAAGRGVVVEAFKEPWVEEHEGLFRAVDNRWAVLDDIARK
ncbi:hypothetical protein C8A01DRAFT_18881 [Parachaetomium inaequale]|uniref:Uncharacterized protein n=1 Tax=Parachaetomium inaequale TaxID=2588326 RepID=A0AAN6P9L6_9PEZI|nr:hypothetical protein C8A01DRAFT_18881 [Parachaetomium inaequale]